MSLDILSISNKNQDTKIRIFLIMRSGQVKIYFQIKTTDNMTLDLFYLFVSGYRKPGRVAQKAKPNVNIFMRKTFNRIGLTNY